MARSNFVFLDSHDDLCETVVNEGEFFTLFSDGAEHSDPFNFALTPNSFRNEREGVTGGAQSTLSRIVSL